MSETGNEPAPKYNRRKLLKLTSGLATLAASAQISQGQKEPTQFHKNPTPETPKNEILTPEELEAYKIKIYDLPQVKMSLRKSIFEEFPLFRDLAQGKLDGIVITLVDASTIKPSAIKNIPTSPREVWEKETLDPTRYPDSFWQEKINFITSRINVRQSDIENWKLEQNTTTDPKNRKYLEDAIENALKQIGQLQTIAQTYSKKDTSAIEEYLEKDSNAKGQYVRIQNKVYIYIAAGDLAKPEPSASIPKPEDFNTGISSIPGLGPEGVNNDVAPNDPKYQTGFSTRHEFFHFSPFGPQPNPEFYADHEALESIRQAYENYQQNGDNSSYSIIFKTEKGEIYTKNSKQVPTI